MTNGVRVYTVNSLVDILKQAHVAVRDLVSFRRLLGCACAACQGTSPAARHDRFYLTVHDNSRQIMAFHEQCDVDPDCTVLDGIKPSELVDILLQSYPCILERRRIKGNLPKLGKKRSRHRIRPRPGSRVYV